MSVMNFTIYVDIRIQANLFASVVCFVEYCIYYCVLYLVYNLYTFRIMLIWLQCRTMQFFAVECGYLSV